MLSLRTIRRPFTGKFQTAVRTLLPFHVTSRGRPAFTERRRGISTFSKFGAWLDSFYFTTVHSDGGTRHPFRSSGHHEREQIGDTLFGERFGKRSDGGINYCDSCESRLRVQRRTARHKDN